MRNTAETVAVCYIPLTGTVLPLQKQQIKLQLVLVWPRVLLQQCITLSCFSQSTFQLANEDSPITNQPQTFKVLEGLLVFLSEIQSPDMYLKSQMYTEFP